MHVLCERLSICGRASFPFSFEGGMWDLIVLIPDHRIHLYQCYPNSLFGVSIEQLVAVTDSAMLGGVVEVVSANPSVGHSYRHS